jgi:hypothetical protein
MKRTCTSPPLFSCRGACVKRLTEDVDLVRRRTDSSCGEQNFLACVCAEAEARDSMKPTTSSRAYAFVGALAGIAFAWTLVLSVSPQLHERVHPDANRVEHGCAVTFVASGNYEQTAHAPLVVAPVASVQFSQLPAFTPQFVESPFLLARVFEHAPPLLS